MPHCHGRRICHGLAPRHAGGRAEPGRACDRTRPREPEHPLDELPSRLADLPGGTLYLMCGSGKRSSQAARILTDRGYQTVNVAGGITEWYRAGHPVTYQQAPDNPSRQQPGHAPAGLRSLLHKLFHRKTT